jgi:hypothetical protein
MVAASDGIEPRLSAYPLVPQAFEIPHRVYLSFREQLVVAGLQHRVFDWKTILPLCEESSPQLPLVLFKAFCDRSTCLPNVSDTAFPAVKSA